MPRQRKVVFVTEGKDTKTVARLAQHLAEHKATAEQIAAASIDMSPAFIKGVTEHLPERPHHVRQVPRHLPTPRPPSIR